MQQNATCHAYTIIRANKFTQTTGCNATHRILEILRFCLHLHNIWFWSTSVCCGVRVSCAAIFAVAVWWSSSKENLICVPYSCIHILIGCHSKERRVESFSDNDDGKWCPDEAAFLSLPYRIWWFGVVRSTFIPPQQVHILPSGIYAVYMDNPIISITSAKKLNIVFKKWRRRKKRLSLWCVIFPLFD